MISAQAALSWTPAKVCIALSMQAWQGWKHPSKPLLAALTIAPHLSVVMSPLHRYVCARTGSRSS